MATTIYKVQYQTTEMQNGKKMDVYNDHINVVAKDALDAINKARIARQKPQSFNDDVTNKKVRITYANFIPIEVVLLASTG